MDDAKVEEMSQGGINTDAAAHNALGACKTEYIVGRTGSVTTTQYRAGPRFSFLVSSSGKRVSDREDTHELASIVKLFLPGHHPQWSKYVRG